LCFTGNQRSSNNTEGDAAPQQPVTQYDTVKWQRERGGENDYSFNEGKRQKNEVSQPTWITKLPALAG
jgi:hypothetical protein